MSDTDPLREDFLHWDQIQTRWMDNDIYGHVNNVVYYSWIDTIINRYLISAGGFDIYHSPVIAVTAESRCRYMRPVAFPARIDGGLGVTRLGHTSVTYRIGLFPADVGGPVAVGHFVHVCVDRASMRPVPIPERLRAALAEIVIKGSEASEAQ